MTVPVSWAAFDRVAGGGGTVLRPVGPGGSNPFPDGDRIFLEEEIARDPDSLEIVFSTAPNIRWWKEIQIIDGQNHRIGSLACQDDDHGPKSTSFHRSQVAGAKLQFHKAKFLGIHTGMYELSDLESRVGSRLSFTWLEDGA